MCNNLKINQVKKLFGIYKKTNKQTNLVSLNGFLKATFRNIDFLDL